MVDDFNEIYRLYAKEVYRYILLLCRDMVLADDIFAEHYAKSVPQYCKLYGRMFR